MLRRGGALLAAVTILALVPSAAGATVYVSRLSNGGLYVTGDDTSQDVNVTYDESDFFISGAGVTTGVGSNCTSPQPNLVKCSKGLVTYVAFSMGGGDDHWTGGPGGYPLQADGGAGNDTIPGGGGNDTIHGSGGDDVIYGRGGSDEIYGETGTDTVDYSDLQDYFNNPAFVRISLDDVANDIVQGSAPGNIHSDVENVVGTIGPDQLQGSAAANSLVGGTGNDTIVAEDASADSVDCGDGSDTAQIDKLDTVTACEALQGSGAPVPDSTPTTTPTTTTTTTDPPPSGGEPNSNPSPAALGVIRSTIASKFKAGLLTLISRLTVKTAPPPSSIRVSCAGKKKGCPFKSKTLAAKSADTSLTKLFGKAKLKPGAVIEIRVTRAGAIGKVFRFTIRRKKSPKATTLCIAPGATAPSACS